MSSETCAVCEWVNVGCLNLGDPGGKPVVMCHGCIKRERDRFIALLTGVLKVTTLATLEHVERLPR